MHAFSLFLNVLGAMCPGRIIRIQSVHPIHFTLADAKNVAFYKLIVTIFHNGIDRIMAEIRS